MPRLATMLFPVLFTLLLAPTAQAAGADAALQRFVDEVRTLSARFEQVQTDEDGEVLARRAGTFELQRPGRFRWAYDAPYEQLMICDGQRIWNYEPDLAQVTVRDAAEVLSGTPAALLAQGGGALDRNFIIESGSADRGADLVRLKPRSNDADFRLIELWLAKGVPQRMRFVDALGGSSDIRFSAVRTGISLPAERFRFTPPKGAEVIDAGVSP
ncbi:MAG TPA: outer membrane lipoprotein chaperone LolA [Solimonas sp.]